MLLISWVASGLTLLGNIVLIKTKAWYCFLIFMVGNGMFVYYWAVKHEWPTMILCSIFFITNVWGIVKWKEKRPQPEIVPSLCPHGRPWEDCVDCSH
jgi:hypothetical protein